MPNGADPKHPDQPLVWVRDVVRFKKNAVVDFLLEQATAGIKCDLNQIWRLFGRGTFPIEDMEQFYQLIGYSVSGYGEMSNFRDETVRKFDEQAAKMVEERKKTGWVRGQ